MVYSLLSRTQVGAIVDGEQFIWIAIVFVYVYLTKGLKPKCQSRTVIFDLPPLLDIDDAIVFLPNVDEALLALVKRKKVDLQKKLAT